jgi:DNA recombination protein RmuC
MFVPKEACLSVAFQKDGALLDDAMKDQVLIASPVTLLALLKAVGYGWQQMIVADNARRRAEEGKLVYQRISKLSEHLGSLGSSLDQAVEAYNRSVGSLEQRLLPSARRFEELGLETEPLPGPRMLDQYVRSLSAPELVD